MLCPVCKETNLVMSERQGIEIDYCPQCRGVWLDRGELDKIIERAGAAEPPPARSHQPAPHVQHEPRPTSGYRGHDEGYYKKKKRSGFLGELFDFD
jgi:Zn-finger nucleic acid-binding protein